MRHFGKYARLGGALLLIAALLLCAAPVQARAAGGEWHDLVTIIAGDGYTAGLRDDGQVLYAGRREADDPYAAADWRGVERLEQTDSYPCYLVGYFRDGTVRVAGSDECGIFDLSQYRDVEQLLLDGSIAVILHKDGTVQATMAAGENAYDWDRETAALFQKRTPQWRDIRQLCFGYGEDGLMLVGLRADGTVVSTDEDWEKDHRDWAHVEKLCPTYYEGTWALRRDGTLLGTENFRGGPWKPVDSVYLASDSFFALTRDGRVLVGDMGYADDPRLKQVAGWTEVVQLGFDLNGWARFAPTALRSDGTVLTVGDPEGYGEAQWHTESWTGVKTLYSGAYYTFGLRADGKVLATGGEFGKAPYVDAAARWTDIAALFPARTEFEEDGHLVGLRTDGTLVAAGNNDYGQCDLK